MGIAVAVTIVLAFGNQLVLYIHPRYVVFTVIMAVVALVFTIAAVVVRLAPDDDDADEAAPRGRFGPWFAGAAVLLSGVFALAMIVIPPTTLTSATADQRDINSTAVGPEIQSVADADAAPAGAFASFTVRDWASLLRQTSDLSFYEGKPVDVVGFIVADQDDPQNVFYVSRFVVTCCAVDAQPAGIPVYYPNWQNTLAVDEWVQATGEFTTNPSQRSTQSIALDPLEITPVEQPSEPYLY